MSSYAALVSRCEVAQPRFGSARERCVAGPQYHSNRRTELASCKGTRKQPPGVATPFSARYSRAPSHGSLKNSICARDSALQISSRRVASRTSYQLRESLGAARPTRRAADATPPVEPPATATSAPPQRARAVTNNYVRLRGI